jgi:hypothetical protein
MVIFEESSYSTISIPTINATCQCAYHCSFRLDPLRGNVHLQRVRLRVLRVPKVQNFIEQLIHQHKVVLNSFLVEFAKVRLPQPNHPVYELENQRRIRIALGDSDQVDVLVLNMAERRGAEREDRRAHLCIRYYLDSEDVGEAGAAVVAEGAKDEVFALLIEYEDAGEHDGGNRQGI